MRVNGSTFRAMVDAVKDYAIFLLDPKGIVATWNPGAERITGYKAEEIIGQHFSKFYSPEDVHDDKPSRELMLAAKTGKYEEEGWRLRKDGTPFLASVLITPLRDAQGSLEGFVKITRDITMRKRAEEELRQSEEKFRLMTEAVKDYGIFMLDPQGFVATWNSGAERIKGYRAEEIIGKHFFAFYPEEDIKAGKPAWELREAAAKGRIEDEGWRKRKDGSLFWANVVITALRDSKGALRGFSKVTRDVRSRTEEIWRRVIISAPNAILMISNENKVTLANPQAERLFQTAQAEMIGKKIDALIPGWNAKEPRGGLFGHAGAPGLDINIHRADGSTVPVEINTSPVNMPDGLYTLAAIMDITERKHLEKRMGSLNEELERQVRDRTALAEQRLAKLREMASMLTLTEQKERRQLAQILHDHLQQMLVACKIGVGQLSGEVKSPEGRTKFQQVENLIEESIEESRKLTVELSPPVLRDAGLVKALDWLARWMQEKHGLEVAIHADKNVRDPSEDRRIYLFQAVRELLFNVVKHAEIKEAAVTLTMREQTLRIMVEDQGKGFDPEFMFNGVSDQTRFGLLNVRERLELLGCHLIVETAPGEGARFTIYTPVESEWAAAADDLTPVCAQKIRVAQKAIRVLVADDHKILREGLVHVLKSCEDIEIVGEASDGQEAVEMAEDLQPDVIIMDVTMPRLNGIEATRKIMSRHPRIKIVGLSLHEAEDIEATLLAAGAKAYLNKSGPLDDLIRSIRDVASSEAA